MVGFVGFVVLRGFVIANICFVESIMMHCFLVSLLCDLSAELKMRSTESIWNAFKIVEAPHLEHILSQAVIFHISGKEITVIKISCLLD